ncbi:hypothetical protein SI65_05450 [Aspergillus cristatus]|uniref:Pyruvate decarboxylase n=1 Tax=Aspergillus cristatus TaxID=573508 RepID=A0A1E3BCY3_ASPCR|nr:hypothetical protein SI65_05450 [Aspergillus cristatus]
MGTEINDHGATFRDLPAKDFLQALIRELDVSKVSRHIPEIPGPSALPPVKPSDLVSQKQGFWPRLSQFFDEGDIILVETGRPGYNANNFTLPRHARLSDRLAERDATHESESHNPKSGRTVFLIGDGSFQLTAQEMSTIIHQKLNVVIFLINNAGYTIERCIHGQDQGYNSITFWWYVKAPALFGAPEDGEFAARTWEVRTWGDLEAALTIIGWLDAPELLLGWLNKQIQDEMNGNWINMALPSIHTQQMYSSLPQNQTYLITKL